MKKPALLLIMLSLCLSVVSQTRLGTVSKKNDKIRYHGEIIGGLDILTGNRSGQTGGIHILNGIIYDNFWITDIGLGYEGDFDEQNRYIVPIYLETKVKMPFGESAYGFVGFDTGYTAGNNIVKGARSFMVMPFVGYGIRITPRQSMNFSIGYQFRGRNIDGKRDVQGALSVRASYSY